MMNMKTRNMLYSCLASITLTLGTASCTGDLDQMPHVETTSASAYDTLEGFEAVMGKIYTSMVTTGQGKGGENGDLASINGQDYMRCYFNLEECGTDEVASTWLAGDKTADLTYLTWDANDPWVSDMYYRMYYNISLCNEFLRNCTDEKIGTLGDELRHYRAEARTMRAMFYLHGLDLFRRIPFVDEKGDVGSVVPPCYTEQQTADFIEQELKEVLPDLYGKGDCPYGRMPKGGALTLLARLYLNSETWTGRKRYAECIDVCKQLLAEGYSLEADYGRLFNADNHLRRNEIIFALPVDPEHTISWGASTYIVCGEVASTGTSQQAEDYGVTSGWGMFRARGELAALFPAGDKRGRFHTAGQSQYINNIAAQDQTQGYCVKKWTNLKDDGSLASNTADAGVATDFPLMRLADVYLMYAEATVRDNNVAEWMTAVGLLNDLRGRAYGNSSGNIAANNMTLDYIIKERARELYWEGYRRTDLVRFGLFTSADYLWQWKGGKRSGSAVDGKYNYYPIPATELTANPNLSNPEY